VGPWLLPEAAGGTSRSPANSRLPGTPATPPRCRAVLWPSFRTPGTAPSSRTPAR